MREFSSFQLLRNTKKKPPTEFMVFPFGPIETTKGTFNFSKELCEELLNERAEHAARVNIDYDHLALNPQNAGDGKAAGFCDLRARDDGLWAVNVEWTPTARKMLEDGEYRYISPAFNADRKTGDIFELINIAITNIPATKNIRELVAASLVADAAEAGEAEENREAAPAALAQEKPKEETSMAKKKMALHEYINAQCKAKGMSLKKLAELLPMDISKMRALADGDGECSPEEMAALAKAFGHKDTAALTAALSSESGEGIGDTEEPPDEASAKVKTSETAEVPSSRAPSIRTDELDALVLLTGETDPIRQRGAAKALRAKLDQADEDRKTVLALKAKDEANERAKLLKRGKDEGKLTPALIALSESWDLAEFAAFLDAASVVVNRDDVHRPSPEQQVAMVALTEGDRLVAALTNDSTEELAAWKAKDGPSKNPGQRPGQNTIDRSRKSYHQPDEAQLVPLRGIAHRR